MILIGVVRGRERVVRVRMNTCGEYSPLVIVGIFGTVPIPVDGHQSSGWPIPGISGDREDLICGGLAHLSLQHSPGGIVGVIGMIAIAVPFRKQSRRELARAVVHQL